MSNFASRSEDKELTPTKTVAGNVVMPEKVTFPVTVPAEFLSSFVAREAAVVVGRVAIVESLVANSVFTNETDALAGPCVSLS